MNSPKPAQAVLVLAMSVHLINTLQAVANACLQHNVDANANLFQAGPQTAIVRQLDWMHPHCLSSSATEASGPFGWTHKDRAQLQTLDVVLAADTVYDDDLTDAMFCCARLLLRGAQGHMQQRWQGEPRPCLCARMQWQADC